MARNFNLTQTGEEVQHILDTATPVASLQEEANTRQQADTILQQNINAESVRAQQAEQQLQTNIDNEQTRAEGAEQTLQGNIDAETTARQQAVSALAAQITQTLTDYYLKTETMSATEIQTLVSETIAAYYTKLQVDALIEDFITKSVNDLTNYYLKTETFTKAEVQQLIDAVKQFRYQSVAVLPTASAETMNIIYLVPSANPKAENVKDEFITTSQTNEQGVTTYQWEQIGSTTVDLSGYSTTEQMNAAIAQAISTALTSYYTKSETMSTAQVNAAIEQAVNTAITDYYTKSQTDAAINAALANYYTKAQADEAVTAAIATALAAYYTKTEVNALLDTVRQSVTAETNARTDADATLRGLIQQVSTSLANYYLKTETYSKAEVQQLVNAVQQFQYVVAASLPANPGPDTMGIIYLIPSTNPKAQNVKDEFITVLDGSAYKWEQIGSTTVDLSGYSTTEQMNAAINAAAQNIMALIPQDATALNQLADKNWVAAQIAENAGTFRGTFASVEELEATTGNHNNDYAFVGVTDQDGDNDYDRYKFDGTQWVFEYRLNNTHFTSAELAAIRSGITATLVSKLNALPTATELQTALNARYTKSETDTLLGQKQASITDGAQIGLGFGVCDTSADTAAKVVDIPSFILLKNMPVSIRFTNAINVDSATLNVSSTGAKPILIEGAAIQPGMVKTGNVVTLIYDGTNWNIVEILNVPAAVSDLSVDMGLPSGRLWAIANIDVTKQSGFAEVDGKPSPFIYECTFFSWGNTEGHNPISDSAFSYNWGENNEGPYAQTPGAQLTANAGLSFDAARAILGAPWRDPSTEDFAELFANIDFVQADGETVIDASQTNKLVTVNGIVGIYLKSKINGRLLFFPCSGHGSGQSWNSRGSHGYYWSRSLYSQSYGRGLSFSSGGVTPQNYDNRFYGFSRRAVQ